MVKKTFSVNTNTDMEYIIDGVKYQSIDEMPANVRANYEHVFRDSDGNGIPDIVESNGNQQTSMTTENKYIINGVEYDSLENMPANVRAMFEMLVKDKDKNGLPDVQGSGFVNMKSVDTDIIEGAMNALSGRPGTGKYNDIKTISDEAIGIYRKQRNSVIGGKGILTIIIFILFVLFFAI